MPRYSLPNAPTEVIGLYAGSGVFSGRLGDIRALTVLYCKDRTQPISPAVNDSLLLHFSL